MMLKMTNRVLQFSGWLVVAALVVMAAYLVVGRVLTWSISANQDEINAYLRDNGLEYVELGEVEGGWLVHDPRFVLYDVSIKPDGNHGISIDRLVFRLDSIGSFIQGAVALSEVEVTGLRFALRRDNESVWVKGFRRGGEGVDFTQISNLLSYMTQMELSDVRIDLEDADSDERLLQILSLPNVPLQIARTGNLREVYMPLFLRRTGETGADPSNLVTLTGTYLGVPGNSNFSAELFLDAPEINLAGLLPGLRFGDIQVDAGKLKANSWLSVRAEQLDLTGELMISDIAGIRGDSEFQLFDSVELDLRMIAEQGHIAMNVPAVDFSAADLGFSLNNLSIAIDADGSGSAAAVQLPVLEIDEVMKLVPFAGRRDLIGESTVEALAALELSGRLEGVAFLTGGDLEPRLIAEIREVSMQAFRGIPGIDRLDGFIAVGRDKGFLDIDNESFTLDFATLFPEPWTFDSGRGRVTYHLADDQVTVSSGLIELLHGELSAYGKLNLNLPGEKLRHTWGLTLGVLNAELLAAHRYVPSTIPENVSDWLTSAIEGGRADESGLTFHGALPRDAPGLWKSHDLYFKAEDTRLRYHEDWPVVEAGTGIVEVTSYYVRSQALTGRVYDTDIVSAKVNVPLSIANGADTILVEALAEGPFSDGIKVLNETPLADATGQMAKLWSGSGSISGTMAIDVPIGGRSGEPVRPNVDLIVTSDEFNLPEYDLALSKLEGNIQYSLDEGLSSTGFTGESFGRPLSGRIVSELHGDGGEVVLNVEGSIDVADLYQWSDQLLLSRAEGILDYETIIHVPYGGVRDEPYVEATTDLVGVTFNLPYPLAKPEADSTLPFSYRQLFKADSFIVDLNLNDIAKASLKVEGGIATGGRVHFGDEVFGAVTYDGIRMTGHLDYLIYEEWLDVTDALSQISDVSIEDEINEHVESASLAIDKLWLYDLELDDVTALVTREPDAWLAQLENDMLKGQVTVPDSDELPLNIALTELNIESDDEEGDPLGDVNPLELGAVDFSTEHLRLDGEDYGSWQFEFRVAENSARFENLTGRSEGVELQAGSELEWMIDDGVRSSRFVGEILIDDLGAALQQFGYASSIEGKGLKLSTSMSWPGSPAMLDIETLNGWVTVHEGEGRFVQAEAGGALKLIGIFDFASIARRFRFDFSDVLDEGLEFSSISGTTVFDEGQIDVQERIVINGTGGKFTVGGSVDLVSQSLDNDMIVTLPLNRTLPWYAAYSAIATGPLAGASVMLAKLMFENQIDQMSSARYKISGPIDEPNIEFVAIFDDTVREAETAGAEEISLTEEELTQPVPPENKE